MKLGLIVVVLASLSSVVGCAASASEQQRSAEGAGEQPTMLANQDEAGATDEDGNGKKSHDEAMVVARGASVAETIGANTNKNVNVNELTNIEDGFENTTGAANHEAAVIHDITNNYPSYTDTAGGGGTVTTGNTKKSLVRDVPCLPNAFPCAK